MKHISVLRQLSILQWFIPIMVWANILLKTSRKDMNEPLMVSKY